MIEPTETKSKETLDKFIDTMRDIAMEAQEEPEPQAKNRKERG
jgi:glycine dehydrogenase subunit 2